VADEARGRGSRAPGAGAGRVEMRHVREAGGSARITPPTGDDSGRAWRSGLLTEGRAGKMFQLAVSSEGRTGGRRSGRARVCLSPIILAVLSDAALPAVRGAARGTHLSGKGAAGAGVSAAQGEALHPAKILRWGNRIPYSALSVRLGSWPAPCRGEVSKSARTEILEVMAVCEGARPELALAAAT